MYTRFSLDNTIRRQTYSIENIFHIFPIHKTEWKLDYGNFIEYPTIVLQEDSHGYELDEITMMRGIVGSLREDVILNVNFYYFFDIEEDYKHCRINVI